MSRIPRWRDGSLTITLSAQNLWRKIFGSTTEGICGIRVLHIQLAETEVAQRDMPRVVEQDIFRLQVAVYDVEAVQVLERAQELSSVEARAVLVELALALEVVEQLAAVDEGHAKVEFVRGLEGELERHDERVVHEREHGALREDVRDFARARRDVRLADRLEGVYPVRVLLPDLHHLPERALPDDLEEVELLDREPLVARRLEVDLEVERARACGRGVPLIRCVLQE